MFQRKRQKRMSKKNNSVEIRERDQAIQILKDNETDEEGFKIRLISNNQTDTNEESDSQAKFLKNSGSLDTRATAMGNQGLVQGRKYVKIKSSGEL